MSRSVRGRRRVHWIPIQNHEKVVRPVPPLASGGHAAGDSLSPRYVLGFHGGAQVYGHEKKDVRISGGIWSKHLACPDYITVTASHDADCACVSRKSKKVRLMENESHAYAYSLPDYSKCVSDLDCDSEESRCECVDLDTSAMPFPASSANALRGRALRTVGFANVDKSARLETAILIETASARVKRGNGTESE